MTAVAWVRCVPILVLHAVFLPCCLPPRCCPLFSRTAELRKQRSMCGPATSHNMRGYLITQNELKQLLPMPLPTPPRSPQALLFSRRHHKDPPIDHQRLEQNNSKYA